jgi:UDP-glucose 4-epimerase
MTILVTGGRGFIGTALIKQLLVDYPEAEIISLDANLTGVTRDWSTDRRVTYYDDNDVSLINYQRLVEISNDVGQFELVFHFGEYSRLVPSFNNLETVIQSNIKFTSDVARYCLDYKIPLIYSASSSKFDTEGLPDPTLINKAPYTFCKSIMVDFIKNLGEWYGLDYRIAYFYNVYGPGQVEEGEYATVMGIWERQLRNGDYLTVVSPGTQTRDFTHIDDIISGLIAIYQRGKSKGEYHLGTGIESRIIDVASLLVKGDTYQIQMIPELKGERPRSRANINETKLALGWEPKVYLDKYINQVIKELEP